MAPRYTIDHLISLRESPLALKPPGLRPAEEWMGSVAEREQTQRTTDQTKANRERRPATDAKTKHNPGLSGSQKAAQQLTASIIGLEEVILGPPKSHFASAGKLSARSRDQGNEEDLHGTDRILREPRKPYWGDTAHAEPEKEQSGQRRSGGIDTHPWSTGRDSKQFRGEERGDYKRKNQSRDLDQEKDGRTERRPRGFEGSRRDNQSDGRGEGLERKPRAMGTRDLHPWAAARDRPTVDDLMGEKPRSRSFRERDGRNIDAGKPWDSRNSNVKDEDPLWVTESLDSPRKDKAGPTQADFEEFRLMMKAQKARTQGHSESAPPITPFERPPESDTMAQSPVKAKIIPSFDLGELSDTFYDLMGTRGQTRDTDQENVEHSKQEHANVVAKMGKASKFSSLFGNTNSNQVPIQAPPPDASNEDKAGFQRILNLLGQRPSSSTTQGIDTLDLAVPSNPHQSTFKNPNTESARKPDLPKNKDSEFLLQLMRQPPSQGPVSHLKENQIQQHLQHPPPHQQQQQQHSQQQQPQFTSEYANVAQQFRQTSTSNRPHTTHSQRPHPFFDPSSARPIVSGGGDKLNPNLNSNVRHDIPQDSGFAEEQNHYYAIPDGYNPPGRDRPGPPGLRDPGAGRFAPTSNQRQGMVPPPGFQIPPPTSTIINGGSSGPGSGGNGPNSNMPPYRHNLHAGPPQSSQAQPPPGFQQPAPPPPPPGFMPMGPPPYDRNMYNGSDALFDPRLHYPPPSGPSLARR